MGDEFNTPMMASCVVMYDDDDVCLEWNIRLLIIKKKEEETNKVSNRVRRVQSRSGPLSFFLSVESSTISSSINIIQYY